MFWFWINGNSSKEGITADLEALQHAGVGGVLLMKVSKPAVGAGRQSGGWQCGVTRVLATLQALRHRLSAGRHFRHHRKTVWTILRRTR